MLVRTSALVIVSLASIAASAPSTKPGTTVTKSAAVVAPKVTPPILTVAPPKVTTPVTTLKLALQPAAPSIAAMYKLNTSDKHGDDHAGGSKSDKDDRDRNHDRDRDDKCGKGHKDDGRHDCRKGKSPD